MAALAPRRLLAESVRGAGAAVLAWLAMAALSAACLLALGTCSAGLVAALVTAAVSGDGLGLSADLGLLVHLEGHVVAAPLGVASAGAACLAYGLLRRSRALPGTAPAALVVRCAAAVVACLGLLALTAALARGVVTLDGRGGLPFGGGSTGGVPFGGGSAGGMPFGGGFAGGVPLGGGFAGGAPFGADPGPFPAAGRGTVPARLSLVGDPGTALVGGLVRVTGLVLACLLVARPSPLRPAVRAVAGVCAGVALPAVGAGTAVVLVAGASSGWGMPRAAGLAVLGGPNVALAALSEALGVPWSPVVGRPGPALWPVGLVVLLAMGVLSALPAAREPSVAGSRALRRPLALRTALALRRPLALRTALALRRPPALRTALALGAVMAVAAPVITLVSGVSVEAAVEVAGHTVRTVQLGFAGDAVRAAWLGALEGGAAGFAGALVLDAVRRFRASRVRRPYTADPYPRHDAARR
ncbi:streptophobe family protein [Microbispora sp. ATCC PTA-5024]|uniref:streptophobe family protein n=1 Tax=Microbispora sp. ATCC PTA-5024 TaxID=316330 RepID=UPI0003DC59FE|nr:streptophobe family protein [Microbispora sp. ATCC PTA-5024]ETK35625.1 hypothetical protein MPTA5024_12910 [Microbispora sp. ATCC PTA-5024]